MLNGLYAVHCELTNKCNKKCWMCGRRKIEKDYPHLANFNDDMEFRLVRDIANQLPRNIVVQFHNNGEPLLYPKLFDAIKLFRKQIKCMDTNGKLLVKEANKIINNLDTLTVSVIENDIEADEQYEIVKKFIEIKGDKKPRIIYRLLGDVGKCDELGLSMDNWNLISYRKRKERWYELPGIVATRALHSPMGSFGYEKKPTVPEIGICIEALNHLAVAVNGDVSMCVRFDFERVGVIGNLYKNTLDEIWNGDLRQKYLKLHTEGKRNEIPLCDKCEYFGYPVS